MYTHYFYIVQYSKCSNYIIIITKINLALKDSIHFVYKYIVLMFILNDSRTLSIIRDFLLLVTKAMFHAIMYILLWIFPTQLQIILFTNIVFISQLKPVFVSLQYKELNTKLFSKRSNLQ